MSSAKMMADAKDNNEANDVPEGLRPALARLRNLVKEAWPKLVLTTRYVIDRQRDYPKNSDMLSNLEEIERAAILLTNKIVDPRIQGLLSDGYDIWTNALNPTWHGLIDIADRAKRVRTRIPRKQGNSRYYSRDAEGPNDMQTCAIMVAFAHYKDCDQWLNGEKEREECEALWRQAGGGLRKGAVLGLNRTGVWRTYLGKARNYYAHECGKHILNDILTARVELGPFDPPSKAD